MSILGVWGCRGNQWISYYHQNPVLRPYQIFKLCTTITITITIIRTNFATSTMSMIWWVTSLLQAGKGNARPMSFVALSPLTRVSMSFGSFWCTALFFSPGLLGLKPIKQLKLFFSEYLSHAITFAWVQTKYKIKIVSVLDFICNNCFHFIFCSHLLHYNGRWYIFLNLYTRVFTYKIWNGIMFLFLNFVCRNTIWLCICVNLKRHNEDVISHLKFEMKSWFSLKFCTLNYIFCCVFIFDLKK